MSEKESDDVKSLKKKEVKEENIGEKIKEEISSNIKLLNDKFNTMCLNYLQVYLKQLTSKFAYKDDPTKRENLDLLLRMYHTL